MWQQLMDVLGKIGTVYDELAKLGEKKRDALVGIDMEGLAKILDTEEDSEIGKATRKYLARTCQTFRTCRRKHKGT